MSYGMSLGAAEGFQRPVPEHTRHPAHSQTPAYSYRLLRPSDPLFTGLNNLYLPLFMLSDPL